MQQKAFAERFLKHLDKLDSSEIESFVLRMVRERDLTGRIFETLIEAIVVFDSEERISLVNTAARRMLRWPLSKRLIGEKLLDVLENGPLRDEVVSFLAAPRPIKSLDVVLRSGARKVYSLDLLPISPSVDEEGQKGGAALILNDLTSARARQERDAQERQIASLATLTAGVAHDIKNPLNSLSIHAQLLNRSIGELLAKQSARQRKTTSRIGESCEAIGQEVERLRKCVDDFIDAARPRTPTLAPNDLNSIVRAVANMARHEFEAMHIDLETFLDGDLPALMVDEKLLQHALRNLLRNAAEAVKAARNPIGQRQVVMRTYLQDDSVVLEVRDNGCGISKTDLPKVFEPYFTTKFNGSGLGLMAVGRIAREHGGQIAVNSSEDEGTTFTLELPMTTRQVKLLDNQ